MAVPEIPTQVLAAAPWTDGDALKITRVATFLTAPERNLPYLIVRVETTEPGLYGLGCAADPQRTLAVRTVLDEYLDPMLRGRDPSDIEDIHQLLHVSGYWRNASVTNHAAAAIDIALWDIKAKRAGMPLFQLLGGRVRKGAAVYRHADGGNIEEVVEQALAYRDAGFEHIRAQVAIPGVDAYGKGSNSAAIKAARATRSLPWDETGYLAVVPTLFERLRETLGQDVKLLHDVHERLTPPQAIRLARRLEPYNLFFLEDPLAPEDINHFGNLRQGTITPLAMGEIFTDPQQFVTLAERRLIDFARIRVPCVGGVSVARKIIALCEFYGVRTALHGPGDISPIGQSANLAIDVSVPNFGVQEYEEYSESAHEVFPGTPVTRDGMLYPSAKPGLGVDFDEAAAAKYPVPNPLSHDKWTLLRRRDGTIARP